ncbi:glycosyltransferase family 92 protein F13G3.3-like [Gastrophryne carolinensis]
MAFFRTCLIASTVTLFLISFTYYWESHLLKTHISRTFPKFARGTITPLADNKTFVVSAYYDNRESRIVRVITILHDKDYKELFCWFYCSNNDEYIAVKAKVDIHSLRYDFHYGPADVKCKEPANCFSRYISVHHSSTGDKNEVSLFEIKNRDPQPISLKFTVCISTMFGNQDNILTMIQAIEMYRLLGAEKVVIYKNSCSKGVGKVLDYYVSEGLMEIIPWPIDKYLRTSDAWHQAMDAANQIGYYGQTVALNDCLYRNMYRSQYVVFNDFDEVILPRKHKDWNDMMEALENTYPNNAVFLIENHYYPNNVMDPNFHFAFPTNIPGVNILELIHYEPEQPNVYNNHKMIVNPREVVQMSVHFVLKALKGNVDVPNDIAGLHHNRIAKQPNLPISKLIKDTRIWAYNASLIQNVNRVLQQLHYIKKSQR